MATIVTRSSVMAIKVESTEGTPVAPTAAGDYLAMQPDFSMEPAFEELENEELKSSIGRSKSIQGVEDPTASFSHYMRHSGVEGTAPAFGPTLLKAAFGNETVAGTEYDTVAGSTVSVVNVDTGEGSNFQRGQLLLVKDGVNGYTLRPVNSISTDALNLGFDLGGAPASGVDLGKCALYHPAATGHQTLSLWQYMGNEGAIGLMAGARVTEFGIAIAAGELINSTYSLAGLEYFFDPIHVDSDDIYLDFTDDDGTFGVTVTSQMYKNPHELAQALENAMNNSGTTETHSVTYSDSTGKGG